MNRLTWTVLIAVGFVAACSKKDGSNLASESKKKIYEQYPLDTDGEHYCRGRWQYNLIVQCDKLPSMAAGSVVWIPGSVEGSLASNIECVPGSDFETVLLSRYRDVRQAQFYGADGKLLSQYGTVDPICVTGDHLPIQTNDEIQAKFRFLLGQLEKKDVMYDPEEKGIIKRSLEEMSIDFVSTIPPMDLEAVNTIIAKDLSEQRRLNQGANSAVFSSDGGTLALAFASSLTVWDIRKNRPLATIPNIYSWNNGAGAYRISPDGKYLAYGTNNGIAVFDIKERKDIWTSSEYFAAQTLDFAPDGQTIVAGHERTIVKWSVKDGAVLGKITQARRKWGTEYKLTDLQRIFSLKVFNESGTTYLLVGNRDADQVVVFEYDNFAELYDAPYYDGYDLSANSSLLTTVAGNRVRAWEFMGGFLVEKCWAEGYSRVAAPSPDGVTFVSGSWDGSVRIYQNTAIVADSDKAGPCPLVHELQGLTMVPGGSVWQINDVKFSADGRYVVALGQSLNDKKIWIWNVATKKLVKELVASGGAGAVAIGKNGIAFSQDSFSTTILKLTE